MGNSPSKTKSKGIANSDSSSSSNIEHIVVPGPAHLETKKAKAKTKMRALSFFRRKSSIETYSNHTPSSISLSIDGNEIKVRSRVSSQFKNIE